MKLQATIIVSYRADSLAEAGEKLDDVLLRARERGDIIAPLESTSATARTHGVAR